MSQRSSDSSAGDYLRGHLVGQFIAIVLGLGSHTSASRRSLGKDMRAVADRRGLPRILYGIHKPVRDRPLGSCLCPHSSEYADFYALSRRCLEMIRTLHSSTIANDDRDLDLGCGAMA